MIKILIVEDNQSDADLVERELKKSGMAFSSTVVKSRQGYIDALASYSPHIILCDYSLPAFDGMAAFKIAQNTLPDVPFIMVSGTIGEEIAVEMIKSGVIDYAIKDKLYSLAPKIQRALREAEEKIQKKADHEKLKLQHKKLLQIANMQSHQMRVPVVHIKSLYQSFNFEDPTDPINVEILHLLKASAESLDVLIHKIVEKTEQINGL